MLNARQQAEQYVKALPASEGWPPFLIVCDVGHCFEIYADFTGQGKNYTQFPDRQGFRMYLEEPGKKRFASGCARCGSNRKSSTGQKSPPRATREVAERLAKVSKHLEEIAGKDGKKHYDLETVALFLMRCLFTRFAEDVELLPKDSFREILKRCKNYPVPVSAPAAMHKGGFAYAIERDVKQFNGYLFKNRTVLPLPGQEIGELYEAARKDWKLVERAIFGTLLEQALNPAERKKLGAHYTPRAYVERLIVATILEPLRAEWANVQATTEAKRTEGAAALVHFNEKLCGIRILDPACGTGNFLYVSLEDETARRRSPGGLGLAHWTGPLRRLRTQDHRPAPVFGTRSQPSRGGDRPAGALDRLSAMAFPHARRDAARADSARFPDNQGRGRRARLGRE